MERRFPSAELLRRGIVLGEDDWLIIPELRSGTLCPYGRRRRIDQFIFDLLSPGENRIALEHKSSLQDFHNETKRPSKRAPFLDLANRFYISFNQGCFQDVSIRKMIRDLPRECGLLEIGDAGVREIVPAPYRHIDPLLGDSFRDALKKKSGYMARQEPALRNQVDRLVSEWEAVTETPWAKEALLDQIEEIFRADGWKTKTPAFGSGWRADLLAEKDGRKLAFEIDLDDPRRSFISRRIPEYRRAGVEPFWLLAHEPVFGAVRNELPYMVLGGEPNSPEVEIEGRTLPLERTLAELSSGELGWSLARIDETRSLQAVFFTQQCFSCSEEFPAVLATVQAKCRCGMAVSELHGLHPEDFVSLVIPKLGQISPGGRVPLVMPVSRPTWFDQHHKEIINQCPNCGSEHDPGLLSQAFRQARHGESGEIVRIADHGGSLIGQLPMRLDRRHFCR